MNLWAFLTQFKDEWKRCTVKKWLKEVNNYKGITSACSYMVFIQEKHKKNN